MMTSTDLPTIKSISDLSTELNISKEELLLTGCNHCIWRLHGMCPHSSGTMDYSHPSGICEEFKDFLLKLSDGDRNPNRLWENYQLFIMRLQSMKDYEDFIKLDTDIKLLEDSAAYDSASMKRLEYKRDNLKLWWGRLSDSILKGLGKSLDRSSKEDNVDKLSKVITISDFNKIIAGNLDDGGKEVPAEYKDILDGD